MIAQLQGNVVSIGATWLVIDVSGVGFRVATTPTTSSQLHIGRSATLLTSMVVREDAMNLYGFSSTAERDCFELCMSASGVGPKLALAITSVLSPQDFASAVQADDLAALCTVPGIGRKGAQKIVIELKDKVLSLGAGTAGVRRPVSGSQQWREQVTEGLESLGWSTKDAEAACETVAPLAADDPEASVAMLMKAALASLARA